MKSRLESRSSLVTLKSRLGLKAMMSRFGLEAMMSRLGLGRFGPHFWDFRDSVNFPEFPRNFLKISHFPDS